MDIFYPLVQSIVILAMVLIFFGSMFVRLVFKGHRMPQDYSHTPTVTVLMSCFNEGEAVYQTIKTVLESDYPADKLFIVAVDDCSKDDSWEWMQKAAEGHANVTVIRNEKNFGKPKSLLKALALSNSELILNIDSDGVLHKRAIIELTSCFIDEKVGAVGGNVMVRNSETNWLTQLQTLQYNTAFQMSKVTETFAGAVSCISGAIFMIRRQIYVDMIPAIKGRNWLGFEVKDGEDRFMTNIVINMGYTAVVNNRAKVFTDVPENFKSFFSQQIRWRRGFVRMLIWSLKFKNLRDKLKHTTPFSFFRFYMMCLLMFMIPAMISWVLITHGIVALVLFKLQAVILMICVHGLNYLIAKSIGNPIHLGITPFIVAPFWMLVDLTLLTALALLTLTSVSWETRVIGTDK
jgi:cellulose synthase/poly-beta-1,6-N-acetylglucosamine synthase-like glycosyltransferase